MTSDTIEQLAAAQPLPIEWYCETYTCGTLPHQRLESRLNILQSEGWRVLNVVPYLPGRLLIVVWRPLERRGGR